MFFFEKIFDQFLRCYYLNDYLGIFLYYKLLYDLKLIIQYFL